MMFNLNHTAPHTPSRQRLRAPSPSGRLGNLTKHRPARVNFRLIAALLLSYALIGGFMAGAAWSIAAATRAGWL